MACGGAIEGNGFPPGVPWQESDIRL